MESSDKPFERSGSGMQAQLELQREVLEQMARELSTSLVFHTLLDHLTAFIGCAAAAIQDFDTSGKRLRLAAKRGFSPEFEEALVSDGSETVGDSWKYFEECNGVIWMPTAADSEAEPGSGVFAGFRKQARAEGMRCCWVIRAMGLEDSIKAILLLCFSEERRPTADEQEFLSLVANLLSMAVERERSRRLREALDRKLRQSQKMEAIGTLAGGIAHDFNNILGGLFGFLHLAVEDIGPDHPAQEWLREIDGACKRARDLVRQVSTFSRGEEFTRVPLNLESVIKDAVKLVRASLPSSVEIEFQRPNTGLPDILGDHTQIQLAVLNLCTNAWQSMRDGQGRIELGLDLIQLNDGSERFVQLTVSDDGDGIPRENIDRIFDPFYSTRPVGGGTGLGLSVVHGIMSSHEGHVLVDSQPGRGSTFSLQFPAVPMESARPEPVPAVTPGGHGERILFVDDEVAIVTWSRLILERVGYVVEAFADPEIALQEIEGRLDEFDLIVTDLTMPGLSGGDLIRHVREWKPAMPVVLTSGHGVVLTPEEYKDLRPAVILHKPIGMDDLCQALRTALNG